MHYVDEGPSRGRGRAPPARPAHLVLPVPHGGGPAGRAGPARRGAGPHRLRPLRQAARPDRLLGAGPRRLAGAVRRRRRAVRRDPRRAGLGRPDRPGTPPRRAWARAPGRRRQHRAAHGRPRPGRAPGVGLPRQPGRHRHRGTDAARLPAADPGAHAVPPEPLRAGGHRVGGSGRRPGGLRRAVPRRGLLRGAAPAPAADGPHSGQRLRAAEPAHHATRWPRSTAPFLTAFSDGDPATRGWAEVLQAHVPGAAGRAHVTVEHAGHFLQEDRGPQLADVVARFVEGTPPG